MEVLILAGGLGTRISEETSEKPKPMVLLNGKPMLWHIMSIYAAQGHTQFIIAGGYLVRTIEDWAASLRENWSIKVLDTGLQTQTGGRVKQCISHIENELFFMTYGDGLANVDLHALSAMHKSRDVLATVTAVRPPARFGYLRSEMGKVIQFGEKNQADAGWINGGFFLMDKGIFPYIEDDLEPLETGCLPRLVDVGLLSAHHHSGFWQPMDTLREKQLLDDLAMSVPPPWLKIESETF